MHSAVCNSGFVTDEYSRGAYAINELGRRQGERRCYIGHSELGVPWVRRENGWTRQRVQVPGRMSDGLASGLGASRFGRTLTISGWTVSKGRRPSPSVATGQRRASQPAYAARLVVARLPGAASPSCDWSLTCQELCGGKTVVKVAIDGVVQEAQPGELLIDK
jgi:hypothetical protein